MPKPGLETQQKISQIEVEQFRLKVLLDKAKNLLELIEKNNMPDSTPYISFKKGTTMADLPRLALLPRVGIRQAFKNDITQIKQQLEQLRREATAGLSRSCATRARRRRTHRPSI